MALIRNANTESLVRDAVVLDLGDLREQGERMVRAARAEADRIVAQAKIERERIVAGATEQGRAAGHAAGLEAGRAEGRDAALSQALTEHRQRLEEVEAAWAVAIADFASRRDELEQAALKDIVRLATLIAERITKRAIAVQPESIVDQLAAVLRVVVRPTELVVRINPEDRAAVERALPGLIGSLPAIRHVEIVDEAAIERGGCIARTRAEADGSDAGGGEIDARIGTQLDRLVETLLPGEPRTTVIGRPHASSGGGAGEELLAPEGGERSW